MKSVLFTGGTGRFGQAFFCKLLVPPRPFYLGEQAVELVFPQDDRPKRIIVFSRGELAQSKMAQSMPDHDGRMRYFIGDVRDRDRLRRAFEGVDVVVHAAALKRIEVGHYNPVEMVKTNIIGAINVIEAAQDTAVEKVIALSDRK